MKAIILFMLIIANFSLAGDSFSQQDSQTDSQFKEPADGLLYSQESELLGSDSPHMCLGTCRFYVDYGGNRRRYYNQQMSSSGTTFIKAREYLFSKCYNYCSTSNSKSECHIRDYDCEPN